MCAGPACSIGYRLTSASSWRRQASTSGNSGTYVPPVDPLRVVVRRGDVVEAVHLVHVASTDGVLHGEDIVSHLRSAAKPIQAIPLADAYDDLDDDELAIACASHQAEPAQLDAVRKLLARAGATGRRPRVRSARGPARRKTRAQLLRQARRFSGRLQGKRLAVRGLSPARASGAAAHPRAARRRCDAVCDRRLRHPDLRAAADRAGSAADAHACSESRTRCARVRSSSAATVQTTPR